MEKLDAGQKHMLKLVDREKDGDGWAKVSSLVMPLLETKMPPELIEIAKDNSGAGRARLTQQGRGIVDAMAWMS
jgi:hypothetical protein